MNSNGSRDIGRTTILCIVPESSLHDLVVKAAPILKRLPSDASWEETREAIHAAIHEAITTVSKRTDITLLALIGDEKIKESFHATKGRILNMYRRKKGGQIHAQVTIDEGEDLTLVPGILGSKPRILPFKDSKQDAVEAIESTSQDLNILSASQLDTPPIVSASVGSTTARNSRVVKLLIPKQHISSIRTMPVVGKRRLEEPPDSNRWNPKRLRVLKTTETIPSSRFKDKSFIIHFVSTTGVAKGWKSVTIT